MSLGEWRGERYEYAVRATGPLATYVADVDGSDRAKALVPANVRRHERDGMTAEMVRRKVVYGEWESCD